MVAAIIAAEVAFWVLLVSGLTVRYVAQRQRLSIFLLRSVPLVDVALVVLVAIDVSRGAEPSRAHGLAAVYLGVTLAFGHSMVRWADARFRYHFEGGQRPTKPAKGSRAEARGIWTEWLRVFGAGLVATALLLVLIAVEGFSLPTSTEEAAEHPYWGMIALLGVVTAVWFVAGPAFACRGLRILSKQQHTNS